MYIKILRFLQEKESIQKKASEQAESRVKEALADADLEAVAGGGNATCADTFSSGEWCWAIDSCMLAIMFYSAEDGYDQVSDKYESGKQVACQDVVYTGMYEKVMCPNGEDWTGWEEWSTGSSLITEL